MTNLVHIPMRARDFGKWTAMRGFRNTDMAMHALVTGIFGRQGLEPFRLFESESGCSIYGYTGKSEPEIRAMMDISLTPDMPVRADDIRIREMPVLAAGTRVGIDIRVCPIRRKDGKERDAHDVDLEHDRDRSREESYTKWLSEKLTGAADIDGVRLVRYSQVRSPAGNKRERLPVCGPDATLQGTVTVGDPLLFAERLLSGIGRKASYGFGMMLLRPADIC